MQQVRSPRIAVIDDDASNVLRKYGHPANGFGPVETVAKPFDVDHLLGTINRLLSQS